MSRPFPATFPHPRSGFVLAGGLSRRMGRDKALLPWRGTTLIEFVAGEVQRAAGSATIVGQRERYRSLRWPVIEDQEFGRGPLSGLEAALAATQAEWNLVVACDMPQIDAATLLRLLEAAEALGDECLVPENAAGQLEPLCAVYHARCLAAIRQTMDAKEFAVTGALARLRWRRWPAGDLPCFRNVNTIQDWSRMLAHG
jgi:molybdopterin-guanine dinucleotide biosynthesis protein A